MTINAEIVVLCALLAAGAVYVFRPILSSIDHSRRSGPARSGQLPQRPYRAASVACEGQACTAARKLRGEKFLLREAPHLPLPACDKGACNCRYAYHDDRRDTLDERRDLQTSAPDADERRLSSGRRRTDWRLH